MKSKFFFNLSVLVVAIAVASCAGQSNRTNPSGAGAAQMTPSGSSNAQVTDCSWWLPGDGTGISVEQANAHDNAVAAAKACHGSPASGSAPRTADPPVALSGSGNAGAFTAGGYEAYQQGANSVADLNISKRGGMVSSTLRNWQAPTEQQGAITTLAQNTSLVDPFAPSVTGPSTTPEDLFLQGLQAIVDLGDKWELTRGVKDITVPFNQLSDALTRAGTAVGGGTTICPVDSVNGLYDYVSKQKDYLQQLSQKPGSYWLGASGVNAYNPSTISPAQAYLDGWSERLSRVQRLIQELTPMVETSQNVLANPGVLGAYEYRGYMTDVVGCSDTLGQINSELSAASGAIDKLESQLSDARSVVY